MGCGRFLSARHQLNGVVASRQDFVRPSSHPGRFYITSVFVCVVSAAAHRFDLEVEDEELL